MCNPTLIISLLIAVLVLTPFHSLRSAESAVDSDVVVYGATPGGIAAALAVAKENRTVLLVEPTRRIGGMLTHGLSHSDFHSFESLNGPFFEFSQRVLEHYQTTYGVTSAQAGDSWQGTHGEPSVNLRIFQAMLAEQPSISVHTNQRLTSVTVEN